jgi:PAS domain S-box-containing protein
MNLTPSTAQPPELLYRLRQQSMLAEFGMYALRNHDFDSLLQRATELCADGMATDLCKVLEYQPHEDRLLVRAGVGWGEGVIGQATVGADLESPAGFALKTGRAVISNHLTEESRFRTPQLLAEYGVRRAINVIIASGEPFGVLEVDSPDQGQFDETDLAFMQGFANLIGVAIERHRVEAERDDALTSLYVERQLLRDSEERLRLIIEGARDYAILTTDANGILTSWSPGAEATFGWREDEILGQPAAVLFTPEDRAQGVPEQEFSTARNKGVAGDERWHLHKDGHRFWVSGTVRPLTDAQA